MAETLYRALDDRTLADALGAVSAEIAVSSAAGRRSGERSWTAAST